MSIPSTTLAICFTGLMAVTLGCQKQVTEEAKLAQEAANAADSKVAQLERELADLKAGKHTTGATDKEAAEHATQSHIKALERQIADAKKRASAKHQESLAVAKDSKSAGKSIMVEVPVETKLSVKLAKELTTETTKAGDAWEGTLAEPISVGGKVVWPEGTSVSGVVTQSMAAGRLTSGQGGLGIKLTVVGKNDVDAGVFVVVGDKRGERNAKFIGGAAALGALAGLLSDKNNQADHALGGAAIGAAAGTAVAAGTADTVIRIPATKVVTFSLTAPEKVLIKA